MNREEYERVRQLFHQLSELPSAEGERAVDELDVSREMKDELRALLRSSDEETDYPSAAHRVREVLVGELEGTQPSSSRSEAGSMPERIGSFRILDKLGEGGMGVVYKAQREGSRETVALKVIRYETGSGKTIGRFLREAEVLRELRHPGIAAFYESGEAVLSGRGEETSVPYLAMEFVEGEPLSHYVRRRKLAVGEVAELVATICDGLDHAHQAGVVHRDLKPANILVREGTRSGRTAAVPKILDFGVARAIDFDVHTVTETATGMLLGTLPYMSPEQVVGLPSDVDARSDVYALGVILYELLAGRLPYEVRGRSLPVAARMICEEEPTRLGSIASRFRGDIEVVVSKALQKEAGDRYATAADFGADLRRCAAGEQVVAKPTGFVRQAVRFTRRNRIPMTAVALAVAALITGTIFSTLGFVRANAELNRANRLGDVLAATLGSIDPSYAGSMDTQLMRRVLMDAASNLDEVDDPRTEGDLRTVLGRSLLSIAQYDDALPHLERGLELRRATLGELDPRTLLCWSATAHCYGLLGRQEEAESHLLEALAKQPEDPASLAELYGTLADVYWGWSRDEESLEYAQVALEHVRAVEPPDARETLDATTRVAEALRRLDRFEEAEAILVDVVQAVDTIPGALTVRRSIEDSLAELYLQTGRYDLALEHARACYELDLEIYDTHSVRIGNSSETLGTVLIALGRDEEAQELYFDLIDRQFEEFGYVRPLTVWNALGMANAAPAISADQAEALLLELARSIDSGELTERDGLWADFISARLDFLLGRPDRALPKLERVHWRGVELFGRVDRLVLMSGNALGVEYTVAGRLSEAREVLEPIVEACAGEFDVENPCTVCHHSYAEIFLAEGNHV